MVSKSTDSSSKLKQSDGMGNFAQKINHIKRQIQFERAVSIREKLEENGKNLAIHVSRILSEPPINHGLVAEENSNANCMLSIRVENPISRLSGCAQGFGDRDPVCCHDCAPQSSTKLSCVERLPTYTTWIFLDRNQRMADDQSVLGRRRIYYDDQHGSEALICSDSEEENPEHDEDKHDFTPGEDRFITAVFREHGLGEEVVKSVSSFIGATTFETEERYHAIVKKSQKVDEPGYKKGISLDKSLASSLDSFDNLFCRRCMVFDCRLHGCSQNVVYPIEKQFYWSEHEEDRKPCSDQCYLMLNMVKNLPQVPNTNNVPKSASSRAVESGAKDITDSVSTEEKSAPQKIIPAKQESTSNSVVPAEALDMDVPFIRISDESTGKRKVLHDSDAIPPDDQAPICGDAHISSKKQKGLADLDMETGAKSSKADVDLHVIGEQCTVTKNTEAFSRSERKDNVGEEPKVVLEVCESKPSLDSKKGRDSVVSKNFEWKQMEKELYMKGLEIFGKNSCLIARNLLSGLKTCMEVSCYMHNGGVSMSNRSVAGPSSFTDENGKTDTDLTDQDMPAKSRLIRRRGKARKLKYSTKSPGLPSIWKRIADGKNQSCNQYTPCGCTSMCTKQCPCHENGTCCEKYCGCSKSCKNRFRGCHCAKSQCRSRQCPCFAAGRECDPDVCRNCWVSCGDGTLDEPPSQGDGQCGNMRLLLRQQQRILLAKSDVAGWGAFIKNSVKKNDYLGEYTGELISHREADKRGKIYDRANSSFLFDLNDQYVLDAYRKGDKLKFANHSSNPNCYAKVMLVAGDHRVGIFAKEHIDASEELFYDYRYGPDQAPVWARKPEGSKRDDGPAPQGRAKKHQSH